MEIDACVIIIIIIEILFGAFVKSFSRYFTPFQRLMRLCLYICYECEIVIVVKARFMKCHIITKIVISVCTSEYVLTPRSQFHSLRFERIA